MFWFGLIIVSLIIIIWKLFKNMNYWKRKGVIYEPGVPVLGSLWKSSLLLEHVNESFNKLYNKYYDKQCVGFFFFNQPSLLIKDPELIKDVTIKDFDHFVDHNTQFVREDLDFLFGKNLFALKGKRWHEMRSTLSPAFTGSKMKFMFQLMSECGEQVAYYFKQELQKNQNGKHLDIELKDLMSRYTVDVIGTTAFGIKVNSFEDKENEFLLMGRKAAKFEMWKLVVVTFAPWILKMLNTGIFPPSVYTFVRNIIHGNIITRERDGIVRPDMIHILMQARKGALDNDNEDNELDKLYGMNTAVTKINKKIELTEDDIAAQAFVFFLAGYETASTSICFISHELALNPDVQKRIQDEIDEVTERNGGNITYQGLQELKYMDMVIAETHRLWAQGAFIDRVCTKSYTLKTNDGDIHLEPGNVIQIPVFALHHDPKYFPNPKKFDPERFNDENKNSIERFAYMPFGVGPRICIGQRFAILETKIILYHLMKNFDLFVTKKTQIPLKMSTTNMLMVPVKGFNLGLKLR